MLVFEERGKPEYPEKNLSEQRREPTTNYIRILFFRPRLNIPIFLPILGWKYSCNVLNHSCTRVHVFCIVHILYCTITLHVPLIIEPFSIAGESVSFVGLFCRLEKGIILYS